MANNIQTLILSTTGSWSNAIHIPRYPTGKKKFLIVGGKFENSLDQIEVTADQFGMYNFSVTASPPKNQYESNHVMVYYDYAGQWTLLQAASRNIVLPVSRSVTPNILMRGFDAQNTSDLIDPEFGEAIIAFGATEHSVASFDALIPKKLSDVTLNAAAFDYKNPVWFVADKSTNKIHLFNSPASADGLIRYRTISQEFAEALAYYSPANHRRAVAIFSSSGAVTRFDVRMDAQPTINLGYRVVRVVLLAATGAFDPLFAVFDEQGRIHKLDSSFTELSVKSDDFYVNCHESLDAYITRSGKLVGTDINPNLQNLNNTVFWYSFAPGVTEAYCVNLSSKSINRYNFVNGAIANLREQDSELLRYPVTLTNPSASVLISAGNDSTGRRSFATRLAPIDDVSSRNWSYLSAMSNGATTPLYGYVARPTVTLKHTYLPTFGATLPAYDVPLGTSVAFSFTAAFDDKDDFLPIILPEGIVWTAKVGANEVKSVRNGQKVDVVATHAYLTKQPFSFSVGRSSGLVEVIPDPYPDEFTFETIYDVPDYSWQPTAEKTMSGINERIEFSVEVDGVEDPSRVEVYVNGTLTPAPVFMNNGDRFYLRVHHGYNITQIKVTAGLYETEYGIYTVSEIEFPPVVNRAYAVAGTEYRTAVLTNDGITALSLTIDSDIGEFVQGSKAVTLEIGQSTRIVFTPPDPNQKYQIKFGSSRYKYTWDIWTHETWMDAQPDSIYSGGMVVASSDSLAFDSIPDNFITDILIPAGILFEVAGSDVEAPLDSRGVYKNSFELKDVSCDASLKLESYPSHEQPKILKLGNAEISWLHDFTQPVTHESGFTSVPESVASAYDYAFDSRNQDYSVLPTTLSFDAPSPFDFLYGAGYDMPFVSSERDFLATIDNRYSDFTAVSDVWKGFAQSFEMPKYQNAFETVQNSVKGFDFELSALVSDEFRNDFEQHSDKIMFADRNLDPRRVKWNDLIREDAILVADSVREWNAVSDRIETTPSVQSARDSILNTPALPEFYIEANAKSIFPQIPGSTESSSVIKVATDHLWFEVSKVSSNNMFDNESRSTYTYNIGVPAMPVWYIENAPSSSYQMQWENIRIEVHPHDAMPGVPIMYLQPTAEYGPPLPMYFTLNDAYEIAPESRFAPQNLWYKYLSSPRHTETLTVHKIATNIENKVGGDIYRLDTSVENIVAGQVYDHDMTVWNAVSPDVYKQKTSEARNVNVTVIVAGEYTPRPIVNAAYPVNRMEVTMFVPTVDYGEQDPLKKGYFASELDALQNAVNVWNKTPDEVFGIEQPDGTWTWAIKIPCGEYCGDFGCDTRGYLAGG